MLRLSLIASAVSLCFVALVSNHTIGARPPVREAPSVLKGNEQGIGRTISDLKFTDINGQSSRLSRLSEQRPIVILITGTGCPLCKRYAPSLAILEQDYADKEVRFLYVNPNHAEKAVKIQKAIETHGFKGPYVRDISHSIIRSLQAKTTTEAFVLDRDRKLVYRGAVDDQYGFGYALNEPRKTYLRDAIDAVLKKQQPTISATSAPGCELWIDDDEPEATSASAKD